MQPTTEAFQALARSSPWRWRTLHFTRLDDRGAIEAWVRRPGELLTRRPDGSERFEREDLSTASAFVAWSSPDPDFVPPPMPAPVWPQDVQPRLRSDGLVQERPGDMSIRYGDPLYEDYTWVAMLDPVELSHDVIVEGVVATAVDGRTRWLARLRPEPTYEPWCGCCPLLSNMSLALREFAGSPEHLARIESTAYPEAFDVSLDVQTGIVVDVTPIGGDSSHDALSVDIHEVDADLDGVFVGPVR